MLGWTVKSSVGSMEVRYPRASSLLPCPFCHFSTFLSHDGMTPIFSLSSLPPLSRLMDMEGNLTLERKFGRLGFAMEVE